MLEKYTPRATSLALITLPSLFVSCSNSGSHEGAEIPIAVSSLPEADTAIATGIAIPSDPISSSLPPELGPPEPGFFARKFEDLGDDFERFRSEVPVIAEDTFSGAKERGLEWGNATNIWVRERGAEATKLASELGETISAKTKIQSELALEWSIQAEKWSQVLAEQAILRAIALEPKIRDSAAQTLQETKQIASDLAPEAKAAAEESARIIKHSIIASSETLSNLGMKPESQREVLRLGVDIVPVLGALKKYDDARAIYREGIAKGDRELQTKAKALCIVALSELGFDIGLCGSVEWSKGAQQLLQGLNLFKTASSVTAIDVQALEPVTTRLLAVEGVDRATIALLNWDQPDQIFDLIFPSINENLRK